MALTAVLAELVARLPRPARAEQDAGGMSEESTVPGPPAAPDVDSPRGR